MIVAFAIVAIVIAVGCGVLLYAVSSISQRAGYEAEETYQELLREKEITEAMERIRRL